MTSTCEFWGGTNTQPLTCLWITTIYSSLHNTWIGASHSATLFPASHLLSQRKSKKESEVAQSCLTLYNPMDCRLPGSSVHVIFQQEYWSGLPFPSPGDLPNPGIEPGSPTLQADVLSSELPGRLMMTIIKQILGTKCRLSNLQGMNLILTIL